jgi:hypothetical protein
MSTPGTASRRVVLHVGEPKSGTTFLQRTLWRQRDELLDAGFVCPGQRGRDMFLAAIEVRERFESWGFTREELEGTWARLCAEARAFGGTTVMSHELLAAATPPQVERALAELQGLDLHVVLTVRDPARQLVSEWQERVKNGGTQTFGRFQRGVVRQLRSGTFRGAFWRYHDVLGVLDRWGGGLPPQNVHVVVAPPRGADPLVLWRRFGDAVGFDGDAIAPETVESGANQTLGVAQIAVLRRVNEALDGRIPQPFYAEFVKRQFSQGLLAEQRSNRPVCPPELVDELGTLAESWCREIGRRGYSVHGRLDELVPRRTGAEGAAAIDVDPEQESAAAAAAIAALLLAQVEGATAPGSQGPRSLRRVPHAVRRLAQRVPRPGRSSPQP